jgi:hypothetical protein
MFIDTIGIPWYWLMTLTFSYSQRALGDMRRHEIQIDSRNRPKTLINYSILQFNLSWHAPFEFVGGLKVLFE